MALVVGKTYRLENRADGTRSLNVYGTSPSSLANVCLWTSDNSDICQQWVYKKTGSRSYFVCKGDESLALDLFTGTSTTANVTNYNAHVYTVSTTSHVYIEDSTNGYVKIRLANNDQSDKYLTANQGSNGTANGKTVNSAGNVYFYSGGLTDYSQDWKPVLIEDDEDETSEEITVTNMPSGIYNSNTEHFHPQSGMVNGTWSANGGTSKANKVKAFYKMDTTNSDAVANTNINVGDFLGVQSNKGLNGSGNQHLHIEVQRGEKKNPASLPTINQNLDSISPYDYL